MAEKTPKQAAQYIYATGRRKTAVAQVRLIPGGTGKVTVNDKLITSEPTYLAPLVLVGKTNLDVMVLVKGGGFQGQVDAIQHGIARALVELDEELKGTLRKGGFLTRDPRAKERKKPGLKSARRAPQWSKR